MFLDENAMEIRLLCHYRETLVNERTRLINRLRINLVILDPELEASIPSRKLGYAGQRHRVTRRLRAMPQTARMRVAREQVKRIGVCCCSGLVDRAERLHPRHQPRRQHTKRPAPRDSNQAPTSGRKSETA